VEIWKPVVGYEGYYEVSNQGNVRSLDRVVKGPYNKPKTLRGKKITPCANSQGRTRVRLSKDGKGRMIFISNLVAEAFIGPRPEGLYVLHGELGVAVNTVENLSYGTHSKNMGEDKLRDGTDHRGEKHPMVKLTKEEVIRFKINAEKWRQRRWADELGVHESTLSDIKRGKSWGWLEP
jgi:hypothetical protein